MHRILRYRPSPALVVALIALVVASAGSITAIRAGGANSPGAGLAGGNSLPTMIEVREAKALPKWGVVDVIAECPEDYLVVSGGHIIDSAWAYAVKSYPSRLGDKWIVQAVNPVGLRAERANVGVIAMCARAGRPIVP
jgi:hypothetical protein